MMLGRSRLGVTILLVLFGLGNSGEPALAQDASQRVQDWSKPSSLPHLTLFGSGNAHMHDPSESPHVASALQTGYEQTWDSIQRIVGRALTKKDTHEASPHNHVDFNGIDVDTGTSWHPYSSEGKRRLVAGTDVRDGSAANVVSMPGLDGMLRDIADELRVRNQRRSQVDAARAGESATPAKDKSEAISSSLRGRHSPFTSNVHAGTYRRGRRSGDNTHLESVQCVIYVSITGKDSPSCGDVSTPCLSIAGAVNQTFATCAAESSVTVMLVAEPDDQGRPPVFPCVDVAIQSDLHVTAIAGSTPSLNTSSWPILDAALQGRHFLVNLTRASDEFVLTGVRLHNGLSSEPGGSVYVARGGIYLSFVVFENNAGAMGGALAVVRSDDDDIDSLVEISQSLFQNNIGTQLGGAIVLIDSFHDTRISDCNFLNNSATLGGGVSLSTLRYPYVGGKMHAFRVSVTNCLFQMNTAYGAGSGLAIVYGGASMENATVDLSGSTFDTNNAHGGGGAFLFYAQCAGRVSVQLVVSGNTFVGNAAPGGAAMDVALKGIVTNSSVAVTNNIFIGNSVLSDGAHAWAIASVSFPSPGVVTGTSVTVRGNRVNQNVCLGPLVHVWFASPAANCALRLELNIFLNNINYAYPTANLTRSMFGGMLRVDFQDISIQNSVVVSESPFVLNTGLVDATALAVQFGGAVTASSSVQVINCTFQLNTGERSTVLFGAPALRMAIVPISTSSNSASNNAIEVIGCAFDANVNRVTSDGTAVSVLLDASEGANNTLALVDSRVSGNRGLCSSVAFSVLGRTSNNTLRIVGTTIAHNKFASLGGLRSAVCGFGSGFAISMGARPLNDSGQGHVTTRGHSVTVTNCSLVGNANNFHTSGGSSVLLMDIEMSSVAVVSTTFTNNTGAITGNALTLMQVSRPSRSPGFGPRAIRNNTWAVESCTFTGNGNGALHVSVADHCESVPTNVLMKFVDNAFTANSQSINPANFTLNDTVGAFLLSTSSSVNLTVIAERNSFKEELCGAWAFVYAPNTYNPSCPSPVVDRHRLVLRDNVLTGNDFSASLGTTICQSALFFQIANVSVNDAHFLVERNVFDGNVVGIGAQTWSLDASPMNITWTMKRNRYTRNRSDAAAGLAFFQVDTSDIVMTSRNSAVQSTSATRTHVSSFALDSDSDAFTNNEAAFYGGGMYLFGIDRTMPLSQTASAFNPNINIPYRDSIFSLNAIFRNAVFSGNKALQGGAIYAAAGNLTFVNCSFVNNVAVSSGAAIALQFSASIRIVDSVWLNNTARRAAQLYSVGWGGVSIHGGTMQLRGAALDDFEVIDAGDIRLLSGFTIACPRGCSVENATALNYTRSTPDTFPYVFKANTLTFSCNPCPPFTFALGSGRVVGGASGLLDDVAHFPVVCRDCPFGADCSEGGDSIFARPFFWSDAAGARVTLSSAADHNTYNAAVDKVGDGSVTMVRCPEGYCCPASALQCELDFCAHNRAGIMCGSCREGYEEAYGTSGCLRQSECGYVAYWALITCYAVAFAMWLALRFDPQPTGSTTVFFNFVQTAPLLIVTPISQLVQRTLSLFSFQMHAASADSSKGLCVFPGMSSVQKLALQYLLPAYVALLIAIFYIKESLYRRTGVCGARPKRSGSVDSTLRPLLPNGEREGMAYSTDAMMINAETATSEAIGGDVDDALFTDAAVLTRVSTDNEDDDNCNCDACDADRERLESCAPQAGDGFCSGLFFGARGRYGIAAIHLVLLANSAMLKGGLELLHCVSVDGEWRLFRSGDVRCLQPWQIALLVLCVCVILPLPLIIIAVGKYMRRRGGVFAPQPRSHDTGCGCTEKLPSTAIRGDGCVANNTATSVGGALDDESQVLCLLEGPYVADCSYWQSVSIGRRSLLVIITTFVGDPALRASLAAILCCVALVAHMQFRPFHEERVQGRETASLAVLLVLAVLSIRAASNMSGGVTEQGSVSSFSKGFEITQSAIVLLALALFLVVYICQYWDKITSAPSVFRGLCVRCARFAKRKAARVRRKIREFCRRHSICHCLRGDAQSSTCRRRHWQRDDDRTGGGVNAPECDDSVRSADAAL